MPNVTKRPEKNCPTCGEHFVCVRPEQVYCSKQCIRGKGRKHNVCPCGINTGSYQKKYCSSEHRELYGKKKAPTRMVEHVCQTCGDTFERPYHYPAKGMFCSIECSNKQHSRKRARHYRFGDLNLNSSFELRFVACLERLKIEWSPWPDDRPFHYGIDGIQHIYTPDFLVDGLAVETKGWDHPDSTQPIARQRWDYPEPLTLITRDHLNECEHIFNRITFLQYLSIDCAVPVVMA